MLAVYQMLGELRLVPQSPKGTWEHPRANDGRSHPTSIVW